MILSWAILVTFQGECNIDTSTNSGVQSAINGNANDASNLRTATLRGIQKTNEDGIASFKTLFP